jgi:hypothetical protein
MYGKLFASTFSGSMMASGPEVFAVWAYVIAHAVGSSVELNPKLLSVLIGSTPERMQTAIDTLCAPDPASRSKEHEGRRLLREGEYQYRVPTHEKYRAIRDEEDRRDYNRDAKRRQREREAIAAAKPTKKTSTRDAVAAKRTTKPSPPPPLQTKYKMRQ